MGEAKHILTGFILITISSVYSLPFISVLSDDQPVYIQNNCNKTVQIDSFIKLSKRPNLIDGKGLTCQVTLNDTTGNRLFIVFQNSELALKTGSQCLAERVDVFDGMPQNKTLLSGANGLCGKNLTQSFNSSGQTMTIIYTANVNMTFGFNSVLTSFRSAASCDSNEFQCYSDQSCIDAGLRCNGLPNCGDKSDELYCSTAEPTLGPLASNSSTEHAATVVTTMNVSMVTEVTGTTMNHSVMPYNDNGTTIDLSTVSGATTMNTSMMTDSIQNITEFTGTTIVHNSTATTVPTNTTASTSAPVTTPSPAPESSNTGAIVGGVIGGILGTVIIVATLYYFIKVRRGSSPTGERDHLVSS